MKTHKQQTEMNKAMLKAARSASLFVFALLFFSISVYSVPIGPTISVLENTTRTSPGGTLVDSTINGSTPGGFIFTLNLTATQQNSRWKAYVGNVTGTLTLDDADDNTIFQWALTSVTGEVYATRAAAVNWSGINCTWIADGNENRSQGLSSNRTPEHDENEVLSHTNGDDNITATFATTNHSSLTIGSVVIGKNDCFSAQTYQNDASQSFADSDNANFTQVVLYDGAFNKTGHNLVYATEIENDVTGYRSDSTYDFQILLPESGADGFSSSTGYYFYVELS